MSVELYRRKQRNVIAKEVSVHNHVKQSPSCALKRTCLIKNARYTIDPKIRSHDTRKRNRPLQIQEKNLELPLFYQH